MLWMRRIHADRHQLECSGLATTRQIGFSRPHWSTSLSIHRTRSDFNLVTQRPMVRFLQQSEGIRAVLEGARCSSLSMSLPGFLRHSVPKQVRFMILCLTHRAGILVHLATELRAFLLLGWPFSNYLVANLLGLPKK